MRQGTEARTYWCTPAILGAEVVGASVVGAGVVGVVVDGAVVGMAVVLDGSRKRYIDPELDSAAEREELTTH